MPGFVEKLLALARTCMAVVFVHMLPCACALHKAGAIIVLAVGTCMPVCVTREMSTYLLQVLVTGKKRGGKPEVIIALYWPHNSGGKSCWVL